MHKGYIKLFRKITDWDWYKDSNTLALWVHLLIKANHKDTSYRGITIPVGSCVCGLHALSAQTGISVQSIRTSLFNLKSTNDITIKTTNRFSIVSIVNFALYQDNSTSKSTSNLTNNQQTTNKQLTTSKECKEVKNEKNIYIPVLNYLNEKTGKNFSSKSNANIRHIAARFAEGRTFEDFKQVIDKKVQNWAGTEMDKYLRPETLFNATKFESYLNERESNEERYARILAKLSK